MLNYDMQMKILSELDLCTLHEMEDFQNAKNDKLYEMCFDKIKDVACFHRDNWQNKLYFGPTRTKIHTQKSYKHFITFLAESVQLYRIAYLLPKHYIFTKQKKKMYRYLSDQGILGLCCKLYSQFLPDSEYVVDPNPPKLWTNELNLLRPCWCSNFSLIEYDRLMWLSMYPSLKFSINILIFMGCNINYIKTYIEEFDDTNISKLIYYFELKSLDTIKIPPVILNHIISVFASLKTLNSDHKERIKLIFTREKL